MGSAPDEVSQGPYALKRRLAALERAVAALRSSQATITRGDFTDAPVGPADFTAARMAPADFTDAQVGLAVVNQDGTTVASAIEEAALTGSATTDGNPPSATPTPQVYPATNGLSVLLPAVSNADPVTVDVWVSTSTPVDTTGTPTYSVAMPPGGRALQPVASYNGAKVVSGTTYYVRSRARDSDGNGPVSSEVSGSPQPATGVDVVITAATVITDQAFINKLTTLDLSTTSLTSVNVNGGSIAIAITTSATETQEFSGTTLPGTWSSYRQGSTAVPGASVVSSGAPSGVNGSALLIDYGDGTQTAAANGRVTMRYASVIDGIATIRFRTKNPPSQYGDYGTPSLRLALRTQAPDAPSGSSYVALDLSRPDGYGGFSLVSRLSNSESPLATVPYVDTSAQWTIAQLRVVSGQVQGRVYADGATPTAWTTGQQSGILAAGEAALAWVSNVSAFSGVGPNQKVWVDRAEVITYSTGFKVNPDGTGTVADLTTRVTKIETGSAFTTATLLNGWVPYGGNLEAPTYAKDGNVVRLQGSCKSGSGVVLTLPVGMRPLGELYLMGYSGATSVRATPIWIKPNGDVTPVLVDNSHFALSGATFRVT